MYLRILRLYNNEDILVIFQAFTNMITLRNVPIVDYKVTKMY